MSRYERQNYRDVAPAEVDPDRYPITQLKFDGIWGGVKVDQGGHLRYFSRNGQLKHHEKATCGIPSGFFIGEFMYGSEWSKKEERSGRLYLFDLTELKGEDLTRMPYHERIAKLVQLRDNGNLPQHWRIIANYPTLQIDGIWSNLVETGKFEGVVFRNPQDPWHVDILRAKLSLQEDLRIIDYEEGRDRLSGTLGAIIAVGVDGTTHAIGGGLSDKLRKQIWNDRQLYRGRIFICEYKKKFDSGKLRHPNFVDWHPDKTTL